MAQTNGGSDWRNLSGLGTGSSAIQNLTELLPGGAVQAQIQRISNVAFGTISPFCAECQTMLHPGHMSASYDPEKDALLLSIRHHGKIAIAEVPYAAYASPPDKPIYLPKLWTAKGKPAVLPYVPPKKPVLKPLSGFSWDALAQELIKNPFTMEDVPEPEPKPVEKPVAPPVLRLDLGRAISTEEDV